jgi:dTDP-glucose 4,6-dehydratase
MNASAGHAARASASEPLTDREHVLAHTSGLWEPLRGERVLITGGTGFVGRWLLQSVLWASDALDLGAEVFVLTRRPEAFGASAPYLADHPAVRIIAGDIRDFPFPQERCAFSIHAASEAVGPSASDAWTAVDTIVSGTRRVLEFMRQSGGKLLFVSSGAVYGTQAAAMTHIAEDYGGAPALGAVRSAYGEAKRVGETMSVLEAQQAGFAVTIARGFAFVGPHLPLDAGFAIGDFMRDALRGEPVRVTGDGAARRSYLYAADLAIWLWTILFRGASGRAYNVGSQHDFAIADVARVVASAVTPALPVIVEGAARVSEPPQRYVPDTRRAELELGLAERINLKDAVARTLAWHRDRAAVGHRA